MKKKKTDVDNLTTLDKKQNPKSEQNLKSQNKKFKNPTPLCMYNEHQKNWAIKPTEVFCFPRHRSVKEEKKKMKRGDASGKKKKRRHFFFFFWLAKGKETGVGKGKAKDLRAFWSSGKVNCPFFFFF
jgi:hypothetical protein